MGTEVLPPQDPLAAGFHASPALFHRRRNFSAGGHLTHLIVNRRPIYNASHRRSSPQLDKRKSIVSGGTKRLTGASDTRRKGDSPAVTIIRRGESLDSLSSKINGGRSKPRSTNRESLDDLAVLRTNRIGPASPGMVPDVYAGSAFSLSPSPRAVPLPSFFNKKVGGEIEPLDDPATRDLRRLLRLD